MWATIFYRSFVAHEWSTVKNSFSTYVWSKVHWILFFFYFFIQIEQKVSHQRFFSLLRFETMNFSRVWFDCQYAFCNVSIIEVKWKATDEAALSYSKSKCLKDSGYKCLHVALSVCEIFKIFISTYELIKYWSQTSFILSIVEIHPKVNMQAVTRGLNVSCCIV